ncbi:MAG: hypothetical protein IPL53_15435 [Ignavibacteria bacterium]|nr:hypothetical protein [Ignavibacteria bacterium]
MQTIVDRHEVVRTVIREEEGQPYQYIKSEQKSQLNITDGKIFKDDPNVLHKFIIDLIKKPFDLSEDNMFRADLITLDEQEYLLVVTIHHIASDAWSMPIIVNEFAELYKSYIENRPANLKPLAIQYADYAIWQRNYLQGEVLEKKLEYWKEKLEGNNPLQLPTDYPRPTLQSNKGASAKFIIEKGITDKLLELSQKNGTSLFMTLLSAYKILLFRYSNQTDICVGTSIASRQYHEIESLIGFFVNTLALRSEVSNDITFKEFIQQVKQTTLDAYSHQEVPF